MWAIVNEYEGPYEIEKTNDEGGGLVQLNGRWFFKNSVEIFTIKESAEKYLQGKRAPWPKGEQMPVKKKDIPKGYICCFPKKCLWGSCTLRTEFRTVLCGWLDEDKYTLDYILGLKGWESENV